MSCLWKLFQRKTPNPTRQTSNADIRITSPLYLDTFPNDTVTLQAIEAVLIDNLISIHYKLERVKENVTYSLNRGHSSKVKDALAKRAVLTEQKKIYEARLARVQLRLTVSNS